MPFVIHGETDPENVTLARDASTTSRTEERQEIADVHDSHRVIALLQCSVFLGTRAICHLAHEISPFHAAAGIDRNLSNTGVGFERSTQTHQLSAGVAALEIGPGDEVILPAWTWYAVYDPVVLAGAL